MFFSLKNSLGEVKMKSQSLGLKTGYISSNWPNATTTDLNPCDLTENQDGKKKKKKGVGGGEHLKKKKTFGLKEKDFQLLQKN